jgi:hypothetical protein
MICFFCKNFEIFVKTETSQAFEFFKIKFLCK